MNANSPALKVTYSYSGNVDNITGTASNFILNINSSSDRNSVANTIASSGGTTTMVYPDTSSGDTAYYVEVQAAGHWSVTVTEVS